MTTLSHLECSSCHKQVPKGRPHNLCECGGPLLARYDLETARKNWNREWLLRAPSSMWRYMPVLPVADPKSVISLGEGFTPMVRVRKLGAENLWMKDDGLNPTGSFKARGLSCAVSMAAELGIGKLAIPSAGNAAGALAAYAAAAGIEAHVFLPRDVPQANYIECRAHGAKVTLVDGLIGDCARMVAERAQSEGWFDISTLQEPYRVEGKKTIGYEIAEQFRWELPDAILYPTGGGVGLIGMWKAFGELEQLGWIPAKRPKMIVVQAEGCRPVVEAFERGASQVEAWPEPHTVAAGLRVPKPLGGALVLDAVRSSGGCAVAVSDRELLEAGAELAAREGIFAAPEGAACVAAAGKLLANGFLNAKDRIVLCNTGTGMKYLEAYSVLFPRTAEGASDKLGGLITPR